MHESCKGHAAKVSDILLSCQHRASICTARLSVVEACQLKHNAVQGQLERDKASMSHSSMAL